MDRGHLKSWPDEIIQEPLGRGEVHLRRPASTDVGNPWRRNELDFFASVKSRQRPLCDVEIGHRTVTMCHLGNIALWLNRSIKWDPKTERIIGDEAASRWLERPMRAPWHLS